MKKGSEPKFINTDNSVIVFSSFRVPFDMPKSGGEERKKLKKDLRSAIQNMQPRENGILQARYGTTEKKSFYDVENVLFYNIGTFCFKRLAKHGVEFSTVEEKEIVDLRQEYGIPDEYTHYYEYQIKENEKPKKFNGLIAEWENIHLKCLGVKPEKVWKTIKLGESNIQMYNEIDCGFGDTFALVLDIETPKNTRFNIMTAMKPLLDGLICAFHSSQFNVEELKYFSQKLNCDKLLFNQDTINVLGEREGKYIQEYRNNVKWNPADDKCNYVYISVKEGEKWSVNGKIYSTVKCPNCGKGNPSKLLWGMPVYSEELQRDIDSGKIRLAGCCIIDDNPTRYYCRWCKNEF